MRCHIILINPAKAEHVGFVARAIKTMGLSSLRLVGEELQHSKQARKTGYGSHDILDQARCYPVMSAALDELDLTIGTTSKQRIKRYDAHSPSAISRILKSKMEAIGDVGLVFGSEENGLSTKELDQCDLISTIPMRTDYPSLNLSQSVLIYAWELSGAVVISNQQPPNHGLQAQAKEQSQYLLKRLGYEDKPLVYRRIMDRLMMLSANDLELLTGLLSKLNRHH